MLATVGSQPHRTVVHHSYTHIRSLNHFGTNTQVLYLGSFTPPPPPPTQNPFPSPHPHSQVLDHFLLQVPRNFTTRNHNFLLKIPLKNNTFNNTFNIVK